jgi:hypothetical protein
LFFAIKGSDLKGRAQPADSKAGRSDPIGAISPILLVNLLYSQNPLATLSWSLHFLLYFLFFAATFSPQGSDPLRRSWPTAKMFSRTSKTSRETGSDPTVATYVIPLAFTLSLFFQTTLAVAQVYLGHYVGGIMYYLGERMVSVGSPGIALGSFMDQVVLRAYGTFSHPNVLAGYAVISLLIILQLYPAAKGSDPLRKSWPIAKMFSRLQNTIWRPGQTLWVLLIPVVLLVILTQSRSAAISLFGIIIPFYLIKNIKYSLIYFVVILSTTYYLPSLIIPPRSDLSSSGRITLQNLSFSVARSFPVFGTGAQSSISTYPSVDSSVRLLQPDHNSFTLFLSWFGIFGVFALLSGSDPLRKSWLSAKMFSRLQNTIWRPGQTLKVFFPILPLLLFDHYLLTSPQGMFILMLYLSTSSPVLNYIHAQKNR